MDIGAKCHRWILEIGIECMILPVVYYQLIPNSCELFRMMTLERCCVLAVPDGLANSNDNVDYCLHRGNC